MPNTVRRVTQVIELGIEFSPSQRQIIGWQVA